MTQQPNASLGSASSTDLPPPRAQAETSESIAPLTALLGALARRADTSEGLLDSAVRLVLEKTSAKTVALYLCNESSVALIDASKNTLRFAREAVLFTFHGSRTETLPERVEFEREDQLEGLITDSYAKSHSAPATKCAAIPFFDGSDLRGVLVVVTDPGTEIDLPGVGASFNEFSVMLGIITDRYLQKALVDLNAHCLTLLSEEPEQCMRGILKEASRVIGCTGISFFAIDPYDMTDNFHLVGTYPKPMPGTSLTYSKEDNTFTSQILNCGCDCVVNYAALERSELLGFASPKWTDVPSGVRSHTMLYARVTQGGATAGLLRCTNRRIDSHVPWFNWVDMRRARSLASLLLPYYKAAQKEDRFAASLSDISHEIKSVAGSISYAAQNVRDEIQNISTAKKAILKVCNIDKAAKGLLKLLPGLRMEAAIISLDKGAASRVAAGFRPYADLCKPIAEMYVEKLRKRRCTIEHVSPDQLGLIYADIEDFKHIVQNLISNAVKYSLNEAIIYINYERSRPLGQFAAIHFLSQSLLIRPEEEGFIFKYRQRAKSAKDSGIEGEGIGLAIARAKARQYNGDVIYGKRDAFNVFSLLIPRVLFQPARKDMNNE